MAVYYKFMPLIRYWFLIRGLTFFFDFSIVLSYVKTITLLDDH